MRALSVFLLLCVAMSAPAAPVSFRQDVMPVLSRRLQSGGLPREFQWQGGIPTVAAR